MATKTATKQRRAKAQPKPAKTSSLAKRPQPLTLVTGGTGFLGQHLLRELTSAGAKNLRVMTTTNPSWLAELGMETIKGSITNPDDVQRAVEGVAEIYHLAGRVSYNKDDARQMYAVHVDGTRLLAQAARDAGVRSIVMASTSGTIAVTNDSEIVPDEEWPPPLEIIARWPYYASKF